MSESHKQLLKSMLFYELQNHLLIEMAKARVADPTQESFKDLQKVHKYIEDRIEQLGA